MSADDNILNVVDASLGLLTDALPLFVQAGVAPQQLQPMLEPVAVTLLMKTADTNAHLAERAADGLLALGSSQAVGGVSFVAPMALRELPRRQAGNWRSLMSRLRIQKRLVTECGLVGRAPGSVTVDEVLEFAKVRARKIMHLSLFVARAHFPFLCSPPPLLARVPQPHAERQRIQPRAKQGARGG